MSKRDALLQRANLGFLLAKAMQRWNSLLLEGFEAEGFPQVRPSFGSILVPLFEENGLRLGELAHRSRLTKQTITTMVRAVEKAGLVQQRPDPEDGRATRVWLTREARRFQPAAERVLQKTEKTAAHVGVAADLAAARRWLAAFAELPDMRQS